MFKKQLYTTLIYLVHLCWAGTSSAQLLYSDTSTYDSYAALYNKVLLNDQGLPVVMGLVATGINPLRLSVLFSVRQTNGIYQTKFLADSSRRTYYVRSGTALDSNRFFIMGTVVVPLSSTHGVRKGLGIWVNAQGDSLLYKEFEGLPQNNEFWLVDAVHYDNKLFVVCDNRRSFNTWAETQIVLLVIESNGNVLHKKEFGLPVKTEFSHKIILSNSGNLIIAGIRNHIESPYQDISFQSWLFEVDTAGSLIREYLAPLAKRAGMPANLAQTTDGGLVYSTTTLTWPESDMRLWRRGYVERLNSNWQLVMDTMFGTASPYMQQYDMQLLADESIVTCGYAYTGQDSFGNFYGWINKISATGEHLWQRYYLPFQLPNSIEADPVSMVKAPDGGFILAGQGRNYGGTLPKGQYAWLLKVDSMGCLVPGCAVPVRELTKEKLYLKVWPNPASDVLYILYKTKQPLPGAELRLSDMQGRIRQKAVIPEGFDSATGELQYYLSLQNMEAGIYVLQLVYKGQLLAHEKVIVAK